MLGHRFLKLTHIGRKSGLPRQTVLEVVRYDPVTHVCIVASGWGVKSDWLQNVMQHPQVTVQVGSRRFAALAGRLTPEEGERELLDYAHRHPLVLGELVRFMGYRVDGSEADLRALGRLLIMVAFKPEE